MWISMKNLQWKCLFVHLVTDLGAHRDLAL